MARAEDIYERIVQGGEKAIDDFIQTRASEELFLDFKRSADNGSGTRLKDNDRNNLARAIYGFGNSEGGVLVWGVDCRSDQTDPADVAKVKCPLADAARFKSLLEGAVSGCSVPVHSGVKNHAITTTGTAGFVVTLIPASLCPPHQVPGEGKYYIRAGSSFVPAPHQVLAGMFGRRPQPELICVFIVLPLEVLPAHLEASTPASAPVLRLKWAYLLKNKGGVTAREVYVNANVLEVPGELEVDLGNVAQSGWECRCTGSGFYSTVSPLSFRLTPQSSIYTLQMALTLTMPVQSGLRIEVIQGCEGAPPRKYEHRQSREEIERQYAALYDEHARGSLLTQARGDDFIRSLLKADIPSEAGAPSSTVTTPVESVQEFLQ